MTSFNDELSRLLSLARSWIGRDLTDDDVLELVKWLAAQRTMSTNSSAEIERGLAAASAVIAEGRQAAEEAMSQAFQSVRSTPQHAQQSTPPASLQDRVASAEQRVIEGMLRPATAPVAGQEEQMNMAQLSQMLTEIIQIQVREQVDKRMIEADTKLDLKLAEIDNKADLKLTEIANGATEICNKLSADIREQLVRDLAAQARKMPSPMSARKKT